MTNPYVDNNKLVPSDNKKLEPSDSKKKIIHRNIIELGCS